MSQEKFNHYIGFVCYQREFLSNGWSLEMLNNLPSQDFPNRISRLQRVILLGDAEKTKEGELGTRLEAGKSKGGLGQEEHLRNKNIRRMEALNKSRVSQLVAGNAGGSRLYKAIRVFFLEQFSTSLNTVAYYDAICPVYREQQLHKISQLRDKLILSQQEIWKLFQQANAKIEHNHNEVAFLKLFQPHDTPDTERKEIPEILRFPKYYSSLRELIKDMVFKYFAKFKNCKAYLRSGKQVEFFFQLPPADCQIYLLFENKAEHADKQAKFADSDLPPVAAYLKWAVSRMGKGQSRFLPLERIEEKGIKIFSLNDILLNQRVFLEPSLQQYTPFAKSIKEKLCSEIYGEDSKLAQGAPGLTHCRTEAALLVSSHRVSPLKTHERRDTQQSVASSYKNNALLGYTQSKFHKKDGSKFLPKIQDQTPSLDFRQTFSKDLLASEKLLELSPQLAHKGVLNKKGREELKKSTLPKVQALGSTMESENARKLRNSKFVMAHSASHSVLQAFNHNPGNNNDKVASPHLRKILPNTLQTKSHSMRKLPPPKLKVPTFVKGTKIIDKSPRYQNFRQQLKKNLQASLHNKS